MYDHDVVSIVCDVFKESDIYHRHSSVGKNDIICMSLEDGEGHRDDVKRGWDRTTERSMIGLKHTTKVAGNDLVNKVTCKICVITTRAWELN